MRSGWTQLEAPAERNGLAFIDPAGSLSPWSPPREAFLDALRSEIRFDRAMVWLLQPDRPALDELLACNGFEIDGLRAWCDSGHRGASLVKDAQVAGRAVGNAGELGFDGVNPDEHAIVHTLPESLPQDRWWVVALTRADAAFEESDRQSADILLRQWQVSLNKPDEPGMARALAGHDDRPISTDLHFHQTARRLGVPTREFLRRIRDIREQRWEKLHDDTTHDLALEIEDEHFWVIFRRSNAVNLPEAIQWFIDLRPLNDLAPPPVGVLTDDRVARAIGYIHDNFMHNPTLESLAAEVHVSPYHFHRVFSRLVGVSPKRYLQLKQIQIASRLLRTTHIPVREIARLTGFTSHGHFNATFRRIAGASPSEHRRAAQHR